MEDIQKAETTQEVVDNDGYDENIITQLLSFGSGDREQIIDAMNKVVNKNDINEIVDYMQKNNTNENYKEAKAIMDEKKTEEKKENSKDGSDNNNNNNDDNDDKKMEEKKEEKTDSKDDDDDNNVFPVSVYVRIRPLVGDEVKNNHSMIDYTLKTNKKTKRQYITMKEEDANEGTVIKQKKKKYAKREKKYSNFMAVIPPECDNLATFNTCIAPTISNMMNGVATCAFAYGHTGSGKTHTIFGYGDKAPGMYKLFSQSLCKQIAKLNNGTLIQIRFTELYQGIIRDLLSKEKLECFLREDDKGNVHLRGQTVKYEGKGKKNTGKVVVKAITAFHVNTPQEIDKCINEGMMSRNVGKSTLHDKSSRSHAFLEFELVNKELIDVRIELPDQEAELDVLKRKYDLVKKGTGGSRKNAPKMKKKLDKCKATIKGLKKLLKSLENDELKPYIGGQYVFVDLAGNEFGKDVTSNATKEEEKERNEINKSLFALKECIRGLHDSKKRVPYRGSKLTMYLRRYLKGDGSKAIMITNIGPSKQYLKQTINTLQYCHLVAKA